MVRLGASDVQRAESLVSYYEDGRLGVKSTLWGGGLMEDGVEVVCESSMESVWAELTWWCSL